jgi:two-component system cell cycle sensor histidine kinase/response regulator CckA
VTGMRRPAIQTIPGQGIRMSFMSSQRIRVNFDRNGPYIVQSAYLQDKSLRYYFRDTIGLDKDDVFTTKEVGKGTGLGLSVVHSIVQELSGNIEVQSSVGKGTVFEVILPVAEREVERVGAVLRRLPYGKGEQVVWVDDEKSLVTLGCHLLEGLNYRPHGFVEPLECLAAIQNQPEFYSLLVTDFNMPVMNGLQLAEKVHLINPDFPVILCSGYSEKVIVENVSSHGLDYFLAKPICKADLARAIHSALS